jgi:hypothetical protein
VFLSQRSLVVFLIPALIMGSPVGIAEETTQKIAGAAPLFCRDSTGVHQPVVRTDYSRLQEGFIRQFGWRSSLRSTSSTMGYLLFSQNGQPNDLETIVYDVEPHNGGISLLHMHVRMKGVTEDLSGNDMCWKTFAIINVR